MFSRTIGLLALLAGVETVLSADSPAKTGNFDFRLPLPASYAIEQPVTSKSAASPKPQWLKATPANGSTNLVEFGSRVVLQIANPDDLEKFVGGSGLTFASKVTGNTFIFDAPDALVAVAEAQRLAGLPGVRAAYPVIRRHGGLHGPYAPAPTDSFFSSVQWDLENRTTNGVALGGDLNVRAAWPLTLGAGVTVAVVDTGIEMTHVELTNAVAGSPHTNFALLSPDASPANRVKFGAHGTEVSGVIAAQMNTERMTGIAPLAKLASWVIFDSNSVTASDDRLMAAYQFHNDDVVVQNHSWGAANGTVTLTGPTVLEEIGISNAVNHGRGGRGVMMVRSAGNNRSLGGNANESGYASDPLVVSVASVATTGRTDADTDPGACVLVATPVYDAAGHSLLSTDLLGLDGADQVNYFPPFQDLCNYVFDFQGFDGTSAAAAQLSGVAALILSANTNLTYRDVQEILILAARHVDLTDPDLVTNGAGFRVSHNVGFGIPDAGAAVQLARGWPTRPAMTNLTFTWSGSLAIPDDGLRVQVTGPGVPAALASIHTLPGQGLHADSPTAAVKLVDFGYGTNTVGFNLTNRGALIQRDSSATFATKIGNAAQAGAVYAVVYNFVTNTDSGGAPGGDQLLLMGGTDFVPIPAVFIGNTDGEALKKLFATNANAVARISLNSTGQVFSVTNTLSCEHVGVRIKTDHPLRGDLRITLVSPAGTRSVLQAYNTDTSAGPVDWTYYTVHDFFETTYGNWQVSVSDEGAGATGSIQQISLILQGVPIVDADHDGLPDSWETAHFGNLAQGPKDDPDHDGYSNVREYLMGTDPQIVNKPFKLDLAFWDASHTRLSWPGTPGVSYQISGGTNVNSLAVITNIPTQFPEMEWVTPTAGQAHWFYRVQAIPLP